MLDSNLLSHLCICCLFFVSYLICIESSISPPPVKVDEQESSLDKNAPTFSSPNLQPSATVHARNSPGFLNEQSIWKHSIQNKIFIALEKSSESDPAKLLLDLMQISFAGYWTKGEAHIEATAMKSFISLLETVTRALLYVGPQVKEDAIELAVQWKTKLKADTENSLEILGFLQFIDTYGLLSMFTIDEIVKLLGMISQHTQALELCQTVGFADRIPGKPVVFVYHHYSYLLLWYAVYFFLLTLCL